MDVVAGFACKVLVDEGLVSIVPAGVLVGAGAGLAAAHHRGIRVLSEKYAFPAVGE